MSSLTLNRAVPDFKGLATGNKEIALSDLRGHNLVLYFYPKDNTPGCTTEGQDFRDAAAAFAALDTLVFGISRDSLKSHENFKAKQCFPFDLLADTEGKICELFAVIKEKNLYGRKYMGIERSTFLIDKKGVLRREWRKVRVKGHAAEVLAAVRELDAPAQ